MDSSSGRAYEDFVPPHHMVREPPTHTLSVDLSAAGYKKEHIRVQLVHSHRRLIVRGERHVAGNRWSRFRVEFKLPDDCDAKGIQARFEKGIVRVTMPGLKPEQQQQQELNGAAASGVRDGGDRAAPAQPAGKGKEELEKDQDRTKVHQKQEAADQQRAVKSSAKDGGRDDDDDASEGGGAVPSSRQQGYYAFLRDRKKAATTVLGVVLLSFSLGIYIRYSLAP